jgi:hypothetical protein
MIESLSANYARVVAALREERLDAPAARSVYHEEQQYHEQQELQPPKVAAACSGGCGCRRRAPTVVRGRSRQAR